MTGMSWRGSGTQQRVLSLEALGGLLLIGGVAYLLQRRSLASAPGAPSKPAASDEAASPESTDTSSSPEPEPEPEDTSAKAGFRVQTERLTVDETIGTGPLDGAWWPTSENADEAVIGLVGDLGDAFGRVTRIALPMADWSGEQPKTVYIDERPVHLAWFAGMHRRTARVTFETDEAITVVVLPVDSDKEAAKSALSLAAEDRSSANLLQEAGAEEAVASDDTTAPPSEDDAADA